jgi:arginyl-tRNA synthetase
MDKRGYGVTMQVFIGDTGETVGTVMISLGASDAATLGRAMDARTEGWFTEIVSGFSAQREMVHGFSMTCDTYAMAG